jgi:cytoskeletal protein RodZ
MIDGDRDVLVERRIERRAGPSDLLALLVILGVIAAVAFGWWSVGTTPLPQNRLSQAPPSVASPDTFVQPRTTVPEGGRATL